VNAGPVVGAVVVVPEGPDDDVDDEGDGALVVGALYHATFPSVQQPAVASV
jgi:hypothetical protein